MNLKEILKKHELWLGDKKGGKRANLRGIDLRDVDLRNTNLTSADLSYANLRGSDLRNINLIDANLMGADLSHADLSYANLRGADLRYADLKGADLKNIKTNTNTIGYHLACPEEGPFIGYKTAGKYLIKLLIPEDAKRSSATTYKCRCNKAKVLSITNIKTGIEVWEARSNYDSSFRYEVGKVVSVDNFDDNRWNECAPGIHFFMNRENAINY